MPVSVYWGDDDRYILCIAMRSCLSKIGYWRIVCNTMRRPQSRLNIVVIINQTVKRTLHQRKEKESESASAKQTDEKSLLQTILLQCKP
jgi:hypothetical protein